MKKQLWEGGYAVSWGTPGGGLRFGTIHNLVERIKRADPLSDRAAGMAGFVQEVHVRFFKAKRGNVFFRGRARRHNAGLKKA